jgi:dipeptidase E
MLLLTSDGLSNEELINQFRQTIKPQFQKAAIITTASNPFAERHPDIDVHIKIMQQCCIAPDCIDIEHQDPAVLRDYDIIILIGGNPYYLLNIMQQKNCKPLFHELLASGKIILGMSAGSMVLGTTIDFVNLLTPEMDVGLTDYTGLALVEQVICTHASTFVANIANSAQNLAAYESKNKIAITMIDDGQAIFIA